MPLFSSLLVGAGLLCILAGWLMSRSGYAKKPGIRRSRAIISEIEPGKDTCLLSVSFSSPEGTIFRHRVSVEKSAAWYEGMPLLVYFYYHGKHSHEKRIEVLDVQTYGQAYGKGFVCLLSGIILVICGTVLF